MTVTWCLMRCYYGHVTISSFLDQRSAPFASRPNNTTNIYVCKRRPSWHSNQELHLENTAQSPFFHVSCPFQIILGVRYPCSTFNFIFSPLPFFVLSQHLRLRSFTKRTIYRNIDVILYRLSFIFITVFASRPLPLSSPPSRVHYLPTSCLRYFFSACTYFKDVDSLLSEWAS